MPSSAVPASSVVWPLTCRTSRTSFRFLSLSSTIRITLMAGGRLVSEGVVYRCRGIVKEKVEPCPARSRRGCFRRAARRICLRQGKAESRAFLLSACSRRRPGGIPRTPRPGLGRDADAGVAHGDLDAALAAGAHASIACPRRA